MQFSIITVTQDNLAGLCKTAESVENQYHHDYEWLVVDNSLDDGTREFLRTTNAIWISAPDSGLYDAMNTGLARARGDYVIFMTAGARFADTDVLHYLRQVITGTQPGFVYGDAYETYGTDNGVFFKPALQYARMAYGMPTHHQAMLYRRTLLDGLDYNTAYPVAADYAFTCRAVQHAARIEYVPWAISIFEHDELSRQKINQVRREQYQVRNDLGLCSTWQNSAITTGQWLADGLRIRASWLYRRLRSRI